MEIFDNPNKFEDQIKTRKEDYLQVPLFPCNSEIDYFSGHSTLKASFVRSEDALLVCTEAQRNP